MRGLPSFFRAHLLRNIAQSFLVQAHYGRDCALFQSGRSILQSVDENNIPQIASDGFVSSLFFSKKIKNCSQPANLSCGPQAPSIVVARSLQSGPAGRGPAQHHLCWRSSGRVACGRVLWHGSSTSDSELHYLWLDTVWQPQIRRIWGWLHRFGSFAIPKLRLRLPHRIEPCQLFLVLSEQVSPACRVVNMSGHGVNYGCSCL